MKLGRHIIVDMVTAAFLVKDLSLNVGRGSQFVIMVETMIDQLTHQYVPALDRIMNGMKLFHC